VTIRIITTIVRVPIDPESGTTLDDEQEQVIQEVAPDRETAIRWLFDSLNEYARSGEFWQGRATEFEMVEEIGALGAVDFIPTYECIITAGDKNANWYKA
jgi:hypothetical protein